MQHKWMVLLTMFVLFSSLLAPVGAAGAVRAQADPLPTCPPYEKRLLRDRDLLQALPPECVRSYKETARSDESPRQAAPPATVTSTGGPDGYGYTFNDTFPYNWIEATTNSRLTGDDEFTGPVDIGFSFPFYGVPQTQLYFNTNGLITFGTGRWEWGTVDVPHGIAPNHLIAPFWDDLLVGAPYNNGAIYYSQGGSAPDRYFVVEWRNVQNVDDSVTRFSFEAILYENGDIVIQHQNLPMQYYSMVCIEDRDGYYGLEYQHEYLGLTPGKAIRFAYPTAPTARVQVVPLEMGGFVSLYAPKDFPVLVTNSGTRGTDTYDLVPFSYQYWPASYYEADGSTPLTDTDGDSMIDTGPIPQGGSTTIVARYRVNSSSIVGDWNYGGIMLASSLNPAVKRYAEFQMTVPAGFASVFMDKTDGAMNFLTASSNGAKLSKVTPDNYGGTGVALERLLDGNYFYAWSKGATVGGLWQSNIEYALLNPQGSLVRPPAKLTDNTGAATSITDRDVSIAVAPNGTVGTVWVRYLQDKTTGQGNYNVFLATLSSSGALLTGPTNLTNNAVWGTSEAYNVPKFARATIAATSDDRFVIAWENSVRVNSPVWQSNLWYSVRSTAGTGIVPPTALTSNNVSRRPILNSLAGGKVIMTWLQDTPRAYYAVLDSSGAISRPASSIAANVSIMTTSLEYTADAVQLPNGKVALGWGTLTGVQFAILDSSYAPPTGAREITSPSWIPGGAVSVTTDASSFVILTWVDRDHYDKQLYILANSNGQYRTYPVVFYTGASESYLEVGGAGQGNAPYQANLVISGNAGVAGATLSYPGGSTTADSTGYYFINVAPGWSGTVTPSKPGYSFSPASRTYSNLTTDQIGQDYTATPFYTISGNVGVAGATLSYMDGTTKTVTSQADGSYSLIVPGNWSGTVTPSHACFTFNPTSRTYGNVTSNQTAQDFAPSLNAGAGCADIDISVGGASQARFGLEPQGSTRVSFSGLNSGPVKIKSTNAIPLMGAERVVYKVNNVPASFTEMMGLPNYQLDTTYWLPWYNNATAELDTQLRFANVSGSTATVHISIGEEEMPGSPFTLLAGESTKKSFPGVSAGPVKIESDVNIVAAERIVYKINGIGTSFSEMMALPDSQLDTAYYFPWYNNVELDTQLRFANVSDTPASVRVYIGGDEMSGSPFTLEPGASTRQSFTGINDGPVKIQSDVPIVAAERVVYKVNGTNTSFTEMMGLPAKQLDTTYWLPWYNNTELDTQLRFANVSDTLATVHVYVGGVEMANSPFTLEPGASTRQSFAGVNSGPVQIVSDVPIVAAERVVYKVNGVGTSFSEMMGLPDGSLDPVYWLPWYNNVELDTQLRFGMP